MSKRASDGNSSPGANKFDPARFQVPAQDHHGHSAREWCRVNPQVDHEIDAIVQSKNWPFRTKGDFMRWAIVEGIRTISKLAPVPNSHQAIMEIMIENARQAETWTTFKTSMDQTEAAVKSYIATGNEEEALKLLSSTRSLALRIDEDMWRNQILKELENRFGPFLERHKKRAVKLHRAVGQ